MLCLTFLSYLANLEKCLCFISAMWAAPAGSVEPLAHRLQDTDVQPQESTEVKSEMAPLSLYLIYSSRPWSWGQQLITSSSGWILKADHCLHLAPLRVEEQQLYSELLTQDTLWGKPILTACVCNLILADTTYNL